MKKLSVIAVACAAAPAFAGFVEVVPNAQGGFVNNGETIVAVEQLASLRDDTPVIVQGKIVKYMGDDKYLFGDDTGTVTVEIDNEDWAGQTVSPANTVKLYGDVDAGIFRTEVDVDRVVVLN